MHAHLRRHAEAQAADYVPDRSISSLRRSVAQRIALAVIVLLLAPHALRANDLIWFEAESSTATNFPADSGFAARNFPQSRDALSGGEWISISSKRMGEPAFAKYEVDVDDAATFHLWARKFWKHGEFEWRFDDAAWQTCDRKVALADQVDLMKNVCVNWVALGDIALTKGKHRFELRLLAKPGEQQTAAFDCFALSREPFIPNGKLKPGERDGRAEPGTFAWEPPPDRFEAESATDLRRLNEPLAGAKGFLKRSGKDIALGDGTPTRFWGVNISVEQCRADHDSIDYLARKLAKAGVNLVRIHGPLATNLADANAFDAAGLTGVQYAVAALKKQGIYTELSFYFPVWFDVADSSGIRGYDGFANRHPFSLLYFQPRWQQFYRDYYERILTTPSPFTNVPLARESAVGFVELVNEDSFFFWTFSKKSIPPPQWEQLQAQFNAWLKARGELPIELLEAWGMTGDGVKGKSAEQVRRIGLQVRFLAETQRGFYEATAKWLRDDIHVGGLVVPGNWTVTDFRLLDAVERWTYTAGDAIDTHGYFNGNQAGEGSDYSVRPGHTFTDLAAVKEPKRVPLRFNQVADFPQITSEIGFPNPNRFRADGVFLTAAEAAIQGVDGVCFFKAETNYGRDAPMGKFATASPSGIGQFPALALMYRRGDLAEQPPSVVQGLSIEALFEMKGSLAGPAFDTVAAYVGPLVRAFDGRVSSVQPLHVKASRLSTNDAAFDWNSGDGIAVVKTPRFVGATGFLAKSGTIDLGAAKLVVANEYASVAVVSLDDKPIGESSKLLVQAMTEERPFGFRAPGGKIESIGTGPINVKRIDATITLPAGKWRVQALDENGEAKGEASEVEGKMTLPTEAMYCIVTQQ